MSWTSPLLEIEKSVQKQAKARHLNMSAPNASDDLRALIDEAIAAWSLDHRRGLRPYDIADGATVAERAFRNIGGYGPLEPLLSDDDVWEVSVNGPDQIFVKRHHGQSGYHDEVFHDDDHVVRTLTKILDEATGAHRKFDPSLGLQDAQLRSGARLHIVHADIARDGHTIVNIRKFTGIAIRSLPELVSRSMLSTAAASFLTAAVNTRSSIIFSGAPGSGKTTLLSCCAAELDPSLRIVIAEEVFEADIPLPNVAHMQTRAARSDRPEVDLRRLVSGFLRMAPDVAIVGEVRDREALPLLLTLSSGVTGYTTIHAGNARQALNRLRFISQLSESAAELPMSALTNLVTEAVDVVVHCERVNGRPEVAEILAVEDLQTVDGAGAFTTTALFHRPQPGEPLRWTGNMPQRMAASLRGCGFDFNSDGRDRQ